MKTDQKILELVSDCKKALNNESFAYAKHVVFGMAPLLIEAVEQLFGQRKDAYAQTDKIHGENLGLHITLTQIRDVIGATKNWNNAEWSTLPGLVQKALEKSVPEYAKLAHANHALNERNEQQLKEIVLLRNAIAELKAQLTVAERISNDRNEARVTGLSEITQLRNDLANANKIADGYSKQAFELMSEKKDLAVRLDRARRDYDTNDASWRRCTSTSGPRFAEDKIVALVAERDQLRADLIVERRAAKDLLARHQVTVSDFNAACDERDSLRMKLDTQTKIAVACQDAVNRATREQVERMKAIREGKLAERLVDVYESAWSDGGQSLRKKHHVGIEAILSELAQMPIELPAMHELLTALWGTEVKPDVESYPGDRLVTLLRVRLAPLLAAHNATKIELPSIEEMHEQFDNGFEEAISETRGSTTHAADANGLRRVRDLIATRLGLTEQKPTKTETVASIEVSGPAPTLWDQFKKATGRTRQITDERPLYFSDLKALCELLDR